LFRVGIGYDVHPFAAAGDGRKLILGGVELPGAPGLLGHSDADVAAHALCDALLGAMGLGDMGRHFPDTDPRFKNFGSLGFVEAVAAMMQRENWVLINADMTLLAERPKIAEYVGRMKSSLGTALETEPGLINIKATRPEGLGPLGQGEGIACHAVALIGRKA
jgi:2-C-methyl-D-erythritol 2,4-cyclodiphosphate synthase